MYQRSSVNHVPIKMTMPHKEVAIQVPIANKSPIKHTKWNIEIPKRRSDTIKHIILDKTGIEWIDKPEIALYYALDCIEFEDAMFFVEKVKEHGRIHLFGTVEQEAIRYKNRLRHYGYYYVDII